jgi:hypothetical protein
MVVKKLIILFWIFVSIYSCSEKHDSTEAPISNDVQMNDGNKKAVETIISFYKWYRDNPSIQMCLVSNTCNDTFDSTKFYSVDFKATEKYLSTLKHSGYISDQYISYWRDYFKKCEENFRKYPVNEGVADGFDYDFVTNSQDFEEELKTVERAKAAKIADLDDKKIITLEFTTGSTLTFELSGIDGRWYIDKIK